MSYRRLLPAFTGLLLAAGILLWFIARAGTSASLGVFSELDIGVQLGLFGGVLLAMLMASVALIQCQIARPLHRLVNYVKHQQDGDRGEPPKSLMRRQDDIALLTKKIQRLLVTLREQNEQLLEQTLNDPLTGLGNRRLLEQRLNTALPLSRRRMAPLSALMIDVDHFKPYNDHYGHLAGDDCLIEIANVLRDIFRRDTDIVVRLGGEEFVVVLLDVELDEAVRLAEAMRGMLQAVGIPHVESPTAPVVTVSIGVATAQPGTPIDVENLIACADAALYQCKARGRNCITSCIVNVDMTPASVSVLG
ncbi:diguanylate cyclase (GGDEF) domain-containing protein [Modicisalibacter muralis]|uniref:diguanylate cyclase n=1 Tax=Modicisalibacter muralis TaxID=119000 RepID=A0A1G9M5R2_9GAMM|nr:GGDEF domain-containing protein [Halomonas muralis]SDL69642.1 diguanylate cyclase (GGDEF) domain-containing protein [Halomonas muralis]